MRGSTYLRREGIYTERNITRTEVRQLYVDPRSTREKHCPTLGSYTGRINCVYVVKMHLCVCLTCHKDESACILTDKQGNRVGQFVFFVFMDSQTFSVPTSSLTRPSVQIECLLHLCLREKRGVERNVSCCTPGINTSTPFLIHVQYSQMVY